MSYYLQGALGWLFAGLIVCCMFSTTIGPGAWWVMLAVSPYVIAYGIGAIRYQKDDL